jgi:hypothetical protein
MNEKTIRLIDVSLNLKVLLSLNLTHWFGFFFVILKPDNLLMYNDHSDREI